MTSDLHQRKQKLLQELAEGMSDTPDPRFRASEIQKQLMNAKGPITLFTGTHGRIPMTEAQAKIWSNIFWPSKVTDVYMDEMTGEQYD